MILLTTVMMLLYGIAGAYGLEAVLTLCIVCFFLSAVMEVFIRIPFVKQAAGGGILKLVMGDFRESFRFIRKEKPQIGRVTLVVRGINLFLSAMIIVAVPYLITEVLELGSESWANTLYSFTQGALAAGGLTGGISHWAFSGVSFFDMGIYLVITVCCFGIMVLSTMFSVQMISFVQAETPGHLNGKMNLYQSPGLSKGLVFCSITECPYLPL